MSLRLVLKSVTLNDLVLDLGPYFAISTNSVASAAHCVKLVEARCRRKKVHVRYLISW